MSEAVRRAVTSTERLHEAREQLRLYRWLCDAVLSAWRPAVADEPAAVDPASAVMTSTPWPLWQPAWHHERCRPVVLKG